MASRVKAFPYARVPKVTQAEVELRRRFARRALPLDPWQALRALGELIGAELSAAGEQLYVCDPGTLRAALIEPLVGVVLVPSGAAPGRVAILECDPALATWLADRLLGGEGDTDASAPLDDVRRGSLAYAAAKVAGAAALPWRVGPVLTTEDGFVAALGDGGSAVWSVVLNASASTLGGARTIRLWVPRGLLDALPATATTRLPRGLSLRVCADAGEAVLEASVLRSLQEGDVLVPDAFWWGQGRLRLAARGTTRCAWWSRPSEGGLVIEERVDGPPGPTAEGRRMSDDVTETQSEGALDAVGDAPVTLSLELATFDLTLEELAALRPGEVVASGVPIGEAVRLRAGSTIIATGELVEVEGEVGVRLLEIGQGQR